MGRGNPSSDALRRWKSFQKGVEPAADDRTDFAQISVSAQFRTRSSHPHRITQAFIPMITSICHNHLANTGDIAYR